MYILYKILLQNQIHIVTLVTFYILFRNSVNVHFINERLQISFEVKIISEKDLPAISDFLKKSGLNHIIKDKKLSFDWARPYSFVAAGNRKVKNILLKSRREAGRKENCRLTNLSLVEMTGVSQSEAPAGLKNEICIIWRSTLDKVLTCSD